MFPRPKENLKQIIQGLLEIIEESSPEHLGTVGKELILTRVDSLLNQLKDLNTP